MGENLRHDEQENEDYYDERSEADDDVEKGRITFPKEGKLYGREKDLQKLHGIYQRMRSNGKAQTVFLPGYSGTGKSSLVHAFIEELSSSAVASSSSSPSSSSNSPHNPSDASHPPSPTNPQAGRDTSTPTTTTNFKSTISPRVVWGKFEEMQTKDPYSAISDGFNKFCLQTIREDEKRRQQYQQQLDEESSSTTKSIGSNSSVLLEMIPKIVESIGGESNWQLLCDMIPQLNPLRTHLTAMYTPAGTMGGGGSSTVSSNSADDCSGDDAASTTSTVDSATGGVGATGASGEKSAVKFQHVFCNFVKCMATKQHPMIVFLDDLQWSDTSSLDLLSMLLQNTGLKHVLFVGAYRSNEVDDDHPLTALLNDVSGTPSTTSAGSTGAALSRGTGKPNSNVTQMDLGDLSIEDIGQFITDTLHLESPKACRTLTEAVYNKTLGNIFFTMQALEELVRKNGLYYDVMMFTWQWNLETIELENLLSDDVVEMVRSKIEHVPKLLQQALTTASYTRSTIHVDVLAALLQAQGIDLPRGKQELLQMLDKAVLEGLLSNCVGSREYTFAHDRIQEAATLFVQGPESDELKFTIAKVLVEFCGDGACGPGCCRGLSQENPVRSSTVPVTAKNSGNDDWMLFTAVHHLNSIPFQYLRDAAAAEIDSSGEHQLAVGTTPSIANNKVSGTTGNSSSSLSSTSTSKKKKMIMKVSAEEVARTRLTKLNLRAAKLSIDKSAFTQAAESLRAGVIHVAQLPAPWSSSNGDDEDFDNDHYNLALDLYNHLLETEFSVGNHDRAQVAVDQVLQHANCLQDKCLAQFYSIEIITSRKDRNYSLAAQKGVEFLAQHGVVIPRNPKDAILWREKLKLQFKQGKRQLTDLLSGPRMADPYQEAILRLLEQLSRCAVYTNPNLCMMVSYTAQRLSYEQGWNKFLPAMLPHYAILLRKQGKFQEAYKVGVAADEMLNKICEGSSWVRGMNACSGCILHLKMNIAKSIEVFNEVHRVGLTCGDVEWSCMGAMMYALCYFCAGYPTNALFEPKLILFQQEAERLGQPPSVVVTFSIFRQFVLNLQGKGNPNPCLLIGKAVSEDEALAQFEGNTHKQTLRDISIFRLMLSCIFSDWNVAQDMVDRLVGYPEFDFPIARQHLRDVFVGLASFSLAKKLKAEGKNKMAKKYLSLAKQRMQWFTKLAKTGSENAPPIVICFRAEEKPSRERYNAAIDYCGQVGLLHLEAYMTERFGRYLLSLEQQQPESNSSTANDPESRDHSEAELCLTKAMWLYFDWGAIGKVSQMRTEHKFLQGARRSGKTPSALVKFVSSHLTLDDSTSRTSVTHSV